MALSRFSLEFMCDANNISAKELFVLSADEFDKFVLFLTNASTEYDALKKFLFPLYVHVYLVGIWSKDCLLAVNFLLRYWDIFLMTDEGYKNEIGNLADYGMFENTENNPYFQSLWDTEFLVNISEESWALMKRFLEEENCKCLAYFIRFHISVLGVRRDNTKVETLLKFTLEEFDNIQNGKNIIGSSNNESSVTDEENHLQLIAEQDDYIQNGEILLGSTDNESGEVEDNSSQYRAEKNDSKQIEEILMDSSDKGNIVTDDPVEHVEMAEIPTGNPESSERQINMVRRTEYIERPQFENGKSKTVREAPIKPDL